MFWIKENSSILSTVESESDGNVLNVQSIRSKDEKYSKSKSLSPEVNLFNSPMFIKTLELRNEAGNRSKRAIVIFEDSIVNSPLSQRIPFIGNNSIF